MALFAKLIYIPLLDPVRGDLRVELRSPGTDSYPEGLVRAALGRGQPYRVPGQGRDRVNVMLDSGHRLRQVVEERIGHCFGAQRNRDAAGLGCAGVRLDLPARNLGQHLGTQAHAQHRHALLERLRHQRPGPGEPWCTLVVVWHEPAAEHEERVVRQSLGKGPVVRANQVKGQAVGGEPFTQPAWSAVLLVLDY